MNREHRNLLLNGQLVLISPYDPNAGFNVGNAMQRNKLIYALADASLVVSADLNKGGTWTGAVEQLDKLKLVPVYVRSTGGSSPGLDALCSKGALGWPNPQNAEAFEAVFEVTSPAQVASPQPGFVLFSEDGLSGLAPITPPYSPTTPVTAALSEPTPPHAAVSVDEAPTPTPADTLFAAVRAAIQRLLKSPMKEAEVAAALNVSTTQAKAWLQRLADEGVLEKRTKPAGFLIRKSGLFE